MERKSDFLRSNHKEISKQFTKFCFVGSIAFIISFSILFFFTEFVGLYYILSASIAFIFAISASFILNKKWTFNECVKDKVLSKYGKFFIISIFALGINLSTLYYLTEFFGMYYLVSQFYSIFITSCLNFSGTKLWVFR